MTKGSQRLINTANDNDELGAIFSEKLSSTQYTHVVLQEHSTSPVNNYSQFKSGVQGCLNKINATQTNAKVYLYETWGFESFASSKNKTIPESEMLLRDAYDSLGNELSLPVTYVGKAFSKVYTDHSSIPLYYVDDNKHPSYPGSYLSACCHLASMFHVDPRGLNYRGTQGQYETGWGSTPIEQYVDSDTASTLQNVAYEAIASH